MATTGVWACGDSDPASGEGAGAVGHGGDGASSGATTGGRGAGASGGTLAAGGGSGQVGDAGGPSGEGGVGAFAGAGAGGPGEGGASGEGTSGAGGLPNNGEGGASGSVGEGGASGSVGEGGASGSVGAGGESGTAGAGGESGGGGCEVLGIDLLDENYLDEDCDGIDGDRESSILVSKSGADTADCGLEPATACLTIGHGLDRAEEAGRSAVLIQTGTYEEAVAMKSGVAVHGGYDVDWQRGPRAEAAHQVIIQGALDSASQQYLAVKAEALAEPVWLENLVIQGANAQGTQAGYARSSYAVYARLSDITLERVDVLAGDGTDGANGTNGTAASGAPAPQGTDGQSAQQVDIWCSTTERLGGSPGSLSCGSGTSTVGGKGGDGGAMDTDCSNVLSPDLDDRPGKVGDEAVVVTVLNGGGGNPGGVCTGTAPGNGEPGREIHGDGGTGATSRGSVVGNFWAPTAGGDGALGENGGGGGGGGGSGGCDSSSPESRGAGGGGGGAGGCRAPARGSGGKGGGSSFAIFSLTSDVTLIDVSIERGAGGKGGDGGTGGVGQLGGDGGQGGIGDGGSQYGGDGGKGGVGGHSGGGGGGAAGMSVGVLTLNAGSLTTVGTVNYGGGVSGAAGAGGLNGARTESSGTTGAVGGVYTGLTCGLGC